MTMENSTRVPGQGKRNTPHTYSLAGCTHAVGIGEHLHDYSSQFQALGRRARDLLLSAAWDCITGLAAQGVEESRRRVGRGAVLWLSLNMHPCYLCAGAMPHLPHPGYGTATQPLPFPAI